MRAFGMAKRFVFRFRRPIAVVVHLGLTCLANFSAFLIRFDGHVPAD